MADSRRRRRLSSMAAKAGLALLVSALAITACSSPDTDNGGSSGVTTALPSNPATGSPIKIGYLSPEGGPTGQLPEARAAAEAAVKYINASLGGIGTHPIVLDICKEKEDPASARDCANQLVSDGVVAVLSPVTSQGDAVVPIITGAGLAYVSAIGPSASEMTMAGTYVLSGGIPGALIDVSKYAVQRHFKNVAIFAEDAGGVVAGISAFAAPAFKSANVQMETIGVPMGTPDATPQVSAALSHHPDAVEVTGDGSLCTSIVRALQNLGSNVDKILLSSCLGPDVMTAVGSAVEGSDVIDFGDVSSSDPEAVLFRSVMAKYAPDTAVNGLGELGYQTALGLARALQGISGPITTATIRNGMSRAKDIKLPAGHGLTFTCGGTVQPMLPGVCGHGVIVTTIEHGKPVRPQVVQ